MRYLRFLKKIVSWILIATLVLISATTISIYIYKDRLIQHLIGIANQQVATPIHVDGIDINMWDKFPNISLSLQNVIIEESWEDSNDPLLRAEKIYIILNPFDLIKGKLEINEVHIENAKFYIRVNKKGLNNFAIIKKINTKKNDSLTINLKKITLLETEVFYQDFRNNQDHHYYTSRQNASIHFSNNVYNIHTKGSLQINFIKINGEEVVKNKSFLNAAELLFNARDQSIDIKPSEIVLSNAKFIISGKIDLENEKHIQLEVKGMDTNIQTLLSFLPGRAANKFQDYKSKGDVYFDATVSGRIGNSIGATASFGMKNTTITHPETNIQIQNMYLDGNVTISDFTLPESMQLYLNNIKGEIGDHVFEGSLHTSNFTDPLLNINIKGALNIDDLLKLFPIKNIATGSGTISGMIVFEGKIKDLKSIHTINRVKTESKLQFDDVSLTFADNYPPQTILSGNLNYNEHSLVFTNAMVKMGSSRWKMEGSVKNLLPYFASEDQHIGIEANITEGMITLDEILVQESESKHSVLNYSISRQLNLSVQCQLNQLVYGRFLAKNVLGNIKINNQKLFVNNLTFTSMGGKLLFNSLINTQNDRIEITNTTNLSGLNIDSVFYVYKNFGQNWLVADNLKGIVYADVMTDMVFSKELKFDPESLIADISISIESGELIDFEPMRRLEKFVDDDNLSNLKFSDLTNDIHIENKTIYLPKMDVRSNVSNISLSGTHTFDQQILYHVVVPVKSLWRNKNEDAFGAVEDDGTGTKLHLIIAGTTSDYEISYDTKAVGKKIVADLRKEVKELKDAFRKKEIKREEIILEEDEYFEWDEDTTSFRYNQFPVREW